MSQLKSTRQELTASSQCRTGGCRWQFSQVPYPKKQSVYPDKDFFFEFMGIDHFPLLLFNSISSVFMQVYALKCRNFYFSSLFAFQWSFLYHKNTPANSAGVPWFINPSYTAWVPRDGLSWSQQSELSGALRSCRWFFWEGFFLSQIRISLTCSCLYNRSFRSSLHRTHILFFFCGCRLSLP